MRFNYLLFLIFFSTLSTLSAKELVFSTLKGMYLSNVCSQVLVEAYQRIGVDAKIKLFPAKRSLEKSNSGAVDGEVMRIQGTEKKFTNLVWVKPQICAMESRVYVKDANFQLEGWESLKPYKIGIRRGHLYAAKGTEGMDAVEFDSDIQLLKMLDKGRIDVATVIVHDALGAIAKSKLTKIQSLHPPIAYFPLYHYLHKKHADMVPQIEKALQEMTNEGRIDAINQEHLEKQANLIAQADPN